MKQGKELRDALNARLLNKKQMSEMTDINYHDLVRFLSGATTDLSGPAKEKANKFLREPNEPLLEALNEAAELYAKSEYNKALEDAAENAKANINEQLMAEVDKDSILKLKK